MTATRREAEVEARARAKAVRRYEKAVSRRERLLARARRAVPVQGSVAAVTTLLAVVDEGLDGVWVPLAAVSALLAVRAVATLRHPPPLPEPPALLSAPPLPPPGSSAWPVVLRLDAVRAQLARLGALVGPAGRGAADEALQAAAEADTALRWQAARLAAVEPHRGAEPALLHALQEGVACQERLVTALADLVAATDPHVPSSSGRLQDAADALHGLADGLRQLR